MNWDLPNSHLMLHTAAQCMSPILCCLLDNFLLGRICFAVEPPFRKSPSNFPKMTTQSIFHRLWTNKLVHCTKLVLLRLLGMSYQQDNTLNYFILTHVHKVLSTANWITDLLRDLVPPPQRREHSFHSPHWFHCWTDEDGHWTRLHAFLSIFGPSHGSYIYII